MHFSTYKKNSVEYLESFFESAKIRKLTQKMDKISTFLLDRVWIIKLVLDSYRIKKL